MNISILLILLVAAIQAAIAFAEIFFWKSPKVHSRLGFTAEQALTAAPIVANAGLYNAFLAAGLIWALLLGEAGRQIALFFLICVAIAGIFGAATLKKRSVVILQTAPAALAILALLA